MGCTCCKEKKKTSSELCIVEIPEVAADGSRSSADTHASEVVLQIDDPQAKIPEVAADGSRSSADTHASKVVLQIDDPQANLSDPSVKEANHRKAVHKLRSGKSSDEFIADVTVAQHFSQQSPLNDWVLHSVLSFCRADCHLWSWNSAENNTFDTGRLPTEQAQFWTGPRWIDLDGDVITMVASGSHAMALCADGALWSWGNGEHGRLGHGNCNWLAQPKKIDALEYEEVVDIAVGNRHSLALSSDGRVWSWGYGYFGQLGHDNKSDVFVPEGIIGLVDIVSIGCGHSHSVALGEDGGLWTWGYGFSGQLGHGTTSNVERPMRVEKLASQCMRAVAAGGGFTLALDNDGKLWSWGWSSSGQLGLGCDTDVVSTPMQVREIESLTVKSISAGATHSMALDDKGFLWTWGCGEWGRLGRLTHSARKPTMVTSLCGVTAVAGGATHTLALCEDGTLWACGRPDPGAVYHTVPQHVEGITNGIAVAAGGFCSLVLCADSCDVEYLVKHQYTPDGGDDGDDESMDHDGGPQTQTDDGSVDCQAN